MRLDKDDQRALALWAADCAEHVLPCFADESPQDDRPRDAVEAARAWARDEMRVGEARAAAVAAHAAARAATDAAARAAARAAGHAAATAHMAGHATHAAAYAAKAATSAAAPETSGTANTANAADTARAATARERDWQVRRLPEHLRPVVFPAGVPDLDHGGAGGGQDGRGPVGAPW